MAPSKAVKRVRNPEHLSDAKYLLLNGVPTSDEARELGVALMGQLFPSSKRGRGRPVDLKARQAMLMAITADVLLASSIERLLPVFHSLDKNSFRMERLSYDQFQACRLALEKNGFLDHIRGYYARTVRFGVRISRISGGDFTRSWARVSRHCGQPFRGSVRLWPTVA